MRNPKSPELSSNHDSLQNQKETRSIIKSLWEDIGIKAVIVRLNDSNPYNILIGGRKIEVLEDTREGKKIVIDYEILEGPDIYIYRTSEGYKTGIRNPKWMKGNPYSEETHETLEDSVQFVKDMYQMHYMNNVTEI